MLPHPVDVHVGKQLRVQRVVTGLSQEALAKAVGITFHHVQKYERGINRMSASRLYDFARVLNVPVSYFFEGYEDQSGSSGVLPSYSFKEQGSTYPSNSGVAEGPEEEFDYEQVITRETLELMRCYHRIKNATLKRRFVDLLRAVADDKVVMEDESAVISAATS